MESTESWALPPAEREKLLSGPALEPPPGVEPNFDNPPNGGAVAIAVCGTCLVVGSFFVFVRASGMGSSWRKVYISDCEWLKPHTTRCCVSSHILYIALTSAPPMQTLCFSPMYGNVLFSSYNYLSWNRDCICMC